MCKKILRLVRIFLWKIDLFSSSQLLRYKRQNSYSTLTGGVLSLAIIIIFFAILINNSIKVITMSNITSQDFTYFVEEPTKTTFSFNENSNFILGVGISGLNLSDTRRYFDIVLSTRTYSYGTLIGQTIHPLQTCKYEQWAHISQIGANSYVNSNLSNFLCPSQSLSVELQGKFTSQKFQLLTIKVVKCKNQTDPSRPCIDQSIVNLSSSYNVNFYLMNPFVNTGAQKPVSFYLQDRNYFTMTLDSSTAVNLYMTENIISTDQSLLPWSSIKNDTALLVKQLAQVKVNRFKVNNQYLSFNLRKSPYFIYSQRSFQKLDDLFSTIGGLFGFVITFFFYIHSYTQASFEIQMGDRLFYYDQNQTLASGSFNIFYHTVYFIYAFFKQLNIQIPWKKMRNYYQCRQQVQGQLDLSLLMNKITFLQKCMNILYEEHQFRAIYLHQKPNVRQAQDLRINHGLNKIIHKNSKKINNRIKGKVKQKQLQLFRKSISFQQLQSFKQQSENKRQEQPRNKAKRLQRKQSIQQFELIQIVTNFMKNFQLEKKQSNTKKNEIVIIQPQQQQKKSQSQKYEEFQLEDVAGQQHESLKFINTALNDIKLIEQQAKNGNIISQRIYNQLNNDITKQKLVLLKCLQTIVAKKDPNFIPPLFKNKRMSEQTNTISSNRPFMSDIIRKQAPIMAITQENMAKEQELPVSSQKMLSSEQF